MIAFAQAIENLLRNAIQFSSQARSEPRIEVGCRQTGESWDIFVRDNGPGIPQEQREQAANLRYSFLKHG